MDINKYLDTPENQNQNQKNNLDFQNPENLFSQLKNSTNISKPVFENVFSNFEKQTGEQGKQILEDMSKFIEKNDLKDVENIACVCLFIENISKKHGANTEMVINFLKNKNPVLLLKMINSFKDNIKDIENKQHSKQKDQTVSQKDQTVSQKDQTVSQKDQTVSQKDQTVSQKDQTVSQKDQTVSQKKGKKIDQKNQRLVEVKKIAQQLRSEIEQKAPEYKEKIQKQASNIQKQYPQISSDEAYLLSISKEYQKNEDFANKVTLDEKTLKILNFVDEKYSNLKINKIVSTNEISNEIEGFSNEKTEYDNKIKGSIDTSFDLKTQAELSDKYPKLIDKFFQKVVSKNDNLNIQDLKIDYTKYLGKESTKYDAIYKKLGEILQDKTQGNIQDYVKEYKKIALEQYTKTIFSMFEHTVGLENISKNFKAKGDKFDIQKSGNVDLKFDYKGTPLKVSIENGNIMMTNFLARENEDPNHLDIKNEGNFKVQQTKVNHFFKFPALENILSPEKGSINIKELSSKNIQALTQKQLQDKLSSVNSLGNKELMKTELNANMKEQAITYNMLKTYRPPFADNSYLEGKSGTIGQNKKGLYYLMGRIDKTVRYKENGLEELNKTFENNKFKELLSSITGKQEISVGEKLNTYNFFEKLGLLGKNGIIDTTKLEEFNKGLEKNTTDKDAKNFTEKYHNKGLLEGLEIVKENGKLQIKVEQDENTLFSELDEKFLDYKNITV